MTAAGEPADISEAWTAQWTAGAPERRIWRSGWMILPGKSLLPRIPVMARRAVHHGRGQNRFPRIRPDKDRLLDRSSGQQKGALLFPGSGKGAGLLESFRREGHRLHAVDDGLNDVWS